MWAPGWPAPAYDPQAMTGKHPRRASLVGRPIFLIWAPRTSAVRGRRLRVARRINWVILSDFASVGLGAVRMGQAPAPAHPSPRPTAVANHAGASARAPAPARPRSHGVNIASTSDVPPRDLRMSRLQLIRQPARCLRDDLEAARHRIDGTAIGMEPGEVEPPHEISRQMQVVSDIEKRGPR